MSRSSPANWGGIYCIGIKPKKGPYKIGMAENFRHRFASYHTCFPDSFVQHFLLGMNNTGASSATLTPKLFKKVENFLFARLKPHKCIPYMNKDKRSCEWTDSTLNEILSAMIITLKKFNGVLNNKKQIQFRIYTFRTMNQLSPEIKNDKCLQLSKTNAKNIIIGTHLTCGKVVKESEKDVKFSKSKQQQMEPGSLTSPQSHKTHNKRGRPSKPKSLLQKL